MAQTDFFLKIEGIEGESADQVHKNEIDVLSFGWGAGNTGTMAYGGGGGAGKVKMHDFHFTMKFNKASPLLMMRCADLKHIPKAKLSCRKPTGDGGQQEYLVVTMSDILVSNYQTGGHGGDDPIPVDSISLNFSKIEFDYKPQKSDGSLGVSIVNGWDVKENKKV